MASVSHAPAREVPAGKATPGEFAAPQRRVEASLVLQFVREPASGSTILRASNQQPPLKVVRAFQRDDGSALAHLHNVSGGLLGGDQLSLSVQVGPAAKVQLTTTGATRIYRPSHESADTVQSNEIDVLEGAVLEYVPDAIIPFAGARFRQQTGIRLAGGAGLFCWEIFAPGREARGELFELESLEIKTDVWAQERLIATERALLAAPERAISSLARLGPFRYWATFYVCCVGRDASSWLSLENHLRAVAATLQTRGRVLWGISTLVAHGLVVRCMAERGCDVMPGLYALWSAAKLALYGAEPIPPRKTH